MLVLASLPRVWLPRLIDRAERVAAAMEIRGYVDVDLRLLGRERARVADFAASIAALAIAGLAAVLRWGRVG
jgi:energy-coupling factor transporter transmembrane protein EcfT